MKKVFVIIFLITICLIISCSSNNGSDQEQMEKFNSYIGEAQANALTKAIQSFDVFIEKNFKKYPNERARIEAFLVYVKEQGKPNELWKLNAKTDSIIISEFETSGLRKEIWLYGYEEDTLKLDSEVFYFYFPNYYNEPDSLGELFLEELTEELENDNSKIDNTANYKMIQEMKFDSIRFRKMATDNSRSKIPFIMAKFPVKDSTINGYIEIKVIAGDVSPLVVAEGLLWGDVEDYSKPYFKVILVTEFYYYLMRWNLNRNGIYLYSKR